MPKYLVEMHDGRKFQVEANSQPSEEEVLAHMGGGSAPPSGGVVSPNEPDTFMGGFVKSLKDQFARAVGPDTSKQDPFVVHGAPPAVEKFMSTPLGHPTGVDAIDSFTSPAGLTSLAAGAAGGLAESPAARNTVGGAMSTGGNALARGGTALQSSELPLGGAGYLFGGKEGAAIGAAIPRAMRLTGRLIGKAGDALRGPAPETTPPTGPHMDLSTPIQPGGLTQQQIAERIAAVQAAGGLPPMDTPAPKPMLGSRMPPITVSPESPMQPPPPESPMQAPRRAVGAEVVGRENGLTTQQVRDTTGPIRGEAPGAAAGMPSGPADRIIQKLISMGPKGQGLEETAREAYAAAGNDPKTRVQVQAYLDALRKVGYAIPLAVAPALRGRLVQTGQEP